MTQEGCGPYLKAVREIAKTGAPITSEALANHMKLGETERSSALDLAAGWISNLRRWGFVRILRGVKVQGPQRHLQVYALTEWGKAFTGKKARQTSLQRVAANPGKGEKK